jgi:glycerol-3-phosphate dehydrogenase (NAD(P)+)
MKVTVLGAGSWGTTLAIILNQNKYETSCWSIEKADIDYILKYRENKRFLPGIDIPKSIQFSTSLETCMDRAKVIIVAVPSHAVRSVLEKLKKYITADMTWVSVAKGIENETLLRVSEIIEQVGGIDKKNIAVLFGPSHAEEVSRGIPTAIVSASSHIKTAQLVQKLFMTSYFRVYANPDIIGVELGGCLKNVIAVAAGICDGAGFGDNTKAALITRGLVEINRLGVKLGAQPDTFAGLSGMGDLIVTCMSRHSRNRHVGEQIGKGRTLQAVLDEMVMVAEGVKTTGSAYKLARREGVEMPITEEVYKALFENKSPIQAMLDLMTRASKIEDWGG